MMTIFKKTDNRKCCLGCGETGNKAPTAGRYIKLYSYSGKFNFKYPNEDKKSHQKNKVKNK